MQKMYRNWARIGNKYIGTLMPIIKNLVAMPNRRICLSVCILYICIHFVQHGIKLKKLGFRTRLKLYGVFFSVKII